jgi:hypothetical protein
MQNQYRYCVAGAATLCSSGYIIVICSMFQIIYSIVKLCFAVGTDQEPEPNQNSSRSWSHIKMMNEFLKTTIILQVWIMLLA